MRNLVEKSTTLSDRMLQYLRDGLSDDNQTQQPWRDSVIFLDMSKHPKQKAFVDSQTFIKGIRAGRRGGKTTGASALAIDAFMEGKRVLYAAPTQVQVKAFWFEVNKSLMVPIQQSILYKNETQHLIQIKGTKNAIHAKTASNAATLRGDYGDLIILDEFQLMSEDTLEDVVYPMLMDNNGKLVIIYTPPSMASKERTKARDPRYAANLFKEAELNETDEMEAFHFTSLDNPHINKEAHERTVRRMTKESYRREILAEETDDVPGALLKRITFHDNRVTEHPALHRIVVAVDPAGSNTLNSDETGIVVAGVAKIDGVLHGYTLEDLTLRGSPDQWARQAVAAYHKWDADLIIAEKNNGGDMVAHTIKTVDPNINIKTIHASRGKHTRAEPVAAKYEQGLIHSVGHFEELEDQWCGWIPGVGDSPDRLDAEVWAYTTILLEEKKDDFSKSRTSGLYQRRTIPT